MSGQDGTLFGRTGPTDDPNNLPDEDARQLPVEPWDDPAPEPATEPEPEPAELACPYLGMVGDRAARHTFPSRNHLCYAGEPAHVGLGFQLDFCLGGRYPDCARFQRAQAAPPATPAAATAAVAAAPVAFASGERLRIPTERSGGGPSRLVAAMLGVALVTAMVALGLASGIIAIPGLSTATPTPTSSGAPSAAPTDSATPGTPTLPPTATPTATPTEQPTPSPSPTPGQVTHVVQPGETLTSIALIYGVTVEAIIAANGITNPNLILAGTVLIIPVDPSGSPLPLPTASASPQPTASASGSPGVRIYVVQPGDTLSGIAVEFGVTVQAIQLANDIENPNEIFVGQELIIPPP